MRGEARYVIQRTFVLLLTAALAGCRTAEAPRADRRASPGRVVVYTSLDRPYADPILRSFEQQSGVRVAAVYDTEATKSLGLANKIASEQGRPRADVFWSSQVVRVIGLKAQDALAPYGSPNAAQIPARFKDAEDYWTGFAARARVIVYNKKLVSRPPRSRFDLEQPAWRNAVAMANPLFGTTATEAAALFELLGPEKARAHYRALHANGIRIVDGNSVAADWTAQGEVRAALTDTDDALSRIRGGAPLGMVYPDQGAESGARPHPLSPSPNTGGGGTRKSIDLVPPPPVLGEGDRGWGRAPLGTLVIPNTVALVKGGPNPENGRRLIDYLLSPTVEAALALGGARQIPLRSDVAAPEGTPKLGDLHAFDVDFGRVAARSAEADRFLKELFAR